MIATRSSLLALASSLDAQADALKAQAATIRAAIETSESQAPDVITLEGATALLGSKRRAREFFAKAERAGFAVRRIGHAVVMDRSEWERAIETLATKRGASTSSPAPSAPTNSTAAVDDDSPAAIFARAGFLPTRTR